MNTVIRELVVGLWELYGVREIYGVPSGYRGFYSEEPVKLDPKMVDDWHKRGGTALATSRGGFDLERIVDAIERRGYNQVYAIGGDGTMKGLLKIFELIQRRKLKISITGIPKTVDNDIGIIDKSFGFQTAVEMAQQAISAAHVEAVSAVNGIGLVKLMGRSTGHIALHATLSSRDVDCCLIPENDFYLEGQGGLFEFLDQTLKQNGHAVIVVAEGAGQDIIPRTDEQKQERTTIHGVMAGYTGFVSGPINGNYGYIPLEQVAFAKNKVDILDHKWAWVRSVTNQPDFLRGST
uniref:Phosphofructokinase domain-containing protein n=1 Tax=Ananas comosus var. bracteatus TaxID=296719 RepID=A0A6V7QR47_ANACO